jgi:hypothetical protein
MTFPTLEEQSLPAAEWRPTVFPMLSRARLFIEPCLPSSAESSPGWIHEIKHDGTQPDLGERRPSRLVATAAENRLNFSAGAIRRQHARLTGCCRWSQL